MGKLKRSKKTNRYTIIIILLAYWFVATATINSKLSFSVITHDHYVDTTGSNFTKTLYKGERRVMEFMSSEDNLGLILVQFDQPVNTIPFDKEDNLHFSIIEKETKKTIASGNVRSGLIKQSPQIPFGFEKINNSKDKVYKVEIVSTNGNTMNGVNLSHDNPLLVSGYKFEKSQILSSPKTFIDFLLKRNLNYIQSYGKVGYLLESIIYLLPLLLYLLHLKLGKLSGRTLLTLSLVLIVGTIIANIFLVKDKYINTTILIEFVLIWAYLKQKYALSSSSSYLFSGLFFTISFLFMCFHVPVYFAVEKLTLLAFLLLIFGSLQMIGEAKNTNKNQERGEEK